MCHLVVAQKMQNSDVDPSKDTGTSTEGFEDAQCEQECDNPPPSVNLRGIASTAGRLAENISTHPGALDGFFEKLRLLEQEWFEAERKYKHLRIENEKISTQLETEKTKCAVLQKKLKFIQDNHKNFERLKQVYKNMRYQEKSTAEILESGSQTDDESTPPPAEVSEILSCLLRDSLISVKKSDLSEAQESLRALKEMVNMREESWAMNAERERMFKEHINILQHENEMMSELLKVKEMEIKTMKITEEMNSKMKEEIYQYKGLIVKMDKKLRELDRAGRMGKYTMNLSDRERRLLDDAIKRGYGSTKSMSRISTGTASARMGVTRPASAMVTKQSPRTNVSEFKDARGEELKKLEFLTRMKKEIEKKQVTLKEKVQEMINDADVPAVRRYPKKQ